MVRLSCDAFLTELTKLLSRCSAAKQGTLQLSLKACQPHALHTHTQHTLTGTERTQQWRVGRVAALAVVALHAQQLLVVDCPPRHSAADWLFGWLVGWLVGWLAAVCGCAADSPNEDAAKRAASGGVNAHAQARRHKQQQSGKSGESGRSKGSASNKQSDGAAHTPHADTVASGPTASATQSVTEVSASAEPALLLHARLGATRLSSVVSAAQSARLQRQLSSLLTAKVSDGLAGGGKGGAGEVEATRKKRERAKQAAGTRKRQREERAAAVAAGSASSGQVKRHKQVTKRREGNKSTKHAASSSSSEAEHAEMKDGN